MPIPKIKICGITNHQDAALCNKFGADLVGFVFYTGSKRYIPYNKAALISRELQPCILRVGVFVNPSESELHKAFAESEINLAQIISPSLPRLLKVFGSHRILQAYRVMDNFDFTALQPFTGFYVIDSYSANEYGGTGKTFNWSAMPADILKYSFIAGGISVANVQQLLVTLSPFGIDVSSSLESSPGKKDAHKVSEFFQLIKGIE